jgi:hypothetical protein
MALRLTFCRLVPSDESSLLTPSIWKAAERLPVPLNAT